MTTERDGLARLRDYLARAEHLIVGLMTGTSADGVDVALVRFKGLGLESTHELVAYRETPLERPLRQEVLEVAAAGEVSPERLLRLDRALGERYAAAVLELLGDQGVDPRQVDAIGSHGQTVRHVPRHLDGEALSLQIGSPSVLAERTGIAVVSDFRSRDVAAGGEGAPLVPLVDWWLFRSAEESRVLLNLGGIANLTYLPRGGGLEGVTAFDTGPGNAVLDSLVHLHSGGAATHDEGGSGAARGQSSEALLAELMADPFFSLPPPRSTGREHFGARYAGKLREVGVAMELSHEDIMATAVELTAASVAEAVERFVKMRGAVDRVYASGGGTRNNTLMTALEKRLAPVPLLLLERLGVLPEAKEALAFAFLAHQTLSGRPGNVPGATGATRPVILGQITPGATS